VLSISKKDFAEFLKSLLTEYDIFGTRIAEEKYFLNRLNEEKLEKEEVLIHDYRTSEPLKVFFMPPRKIVAKYPDDVLKDFKPKPRILMATKACDFRAFEIYDKVFLEQEFINPFYKIYRENTIIFSSDCKDICEECFCNLLEEKPYLEKDFDINLSDLGDEILVEVGSDKGQELVDRAEDKFKDATKEELKKRDEIRKSVMEKLQEQNQDFVCMRDKQEVVHSNLDEDAVWARCAKTCVECSGCNDVCPTCYCFLLYDQKTDGGFEKVLTWDSCFRAGYTRMAGGLSPRLKLIDRFKRHYHHKFDSFVENYGIVACTGCGRCIDVCMGAIDKRECMTNLCKTVSLK